MNFAEKKKELQKIADKLENSKTGLEEAAALFEQGLALSKECLAMLTAEQGKITKINADGSETELENLD